MKMKISIIIALIIVLTGCSNVKKGVNDTSIENNPVSNNQQSENKVENNNVAINTISNSLKNIDTTKSQFESGYYDYQGTINNKIRIQMSIYPLEKNIVGTYFYEKQRKEIKLVGKAGVKNIILYEYDGTGKNTGVFKGTMKTVDTIKGTWISADSKNSYPFTLSLKSIIPGVEYGKRYMAVLNTKNDQDIEIYVKKIQNFVINDDKEKLAQQITYPITAKINGKVTKIQNKEDFINNYSQIFNPNYKRVISNAFTKYMFVNWQGIMFGEGLYNMWINEVTPTDSNSRLMINAINN